MKKNVYFMGVVLALVVLAGCNAAQEVEPVLDDVVGGSENIVLESGNPASMKCDQDGAKSTTIDSAEGQWSLCSFEDDSICEEWSYFRGECAPGQCYKECMYIDTRSEGWYINCDGRLIEYVDCGNLAKPELLMGVSDGEVPEMDKCSAQGGIWERYYNQIKGVYESYCLYEDGTFCPQDAYSCEPGECNKECRAIGTRSEGWYDTCSDELITFEFCADEKIGMPNPASVKCEEDGYTLKTYDTPFNGEKTYCVFNDKPGNDSSMCEEWAYYQGDCTPDQCNLDCRYAGSRSEGWFDTCNDVRLSFDFCSQANIQ